MRCKSLQALGHLCRQAAVPQQQRLSSTFLCSDALSSKPGDGSSRISGAGGRFFSTGRRTPIAQDLLAVMQRRMASLEGRHAYLNQTLSQPAATPDEIAKINKELSRMEASINCISELKSKLKELEGLKGLWEESLDDNEMYRMAADELRLEEQEEVGSVCSGGCGFALAITESGKVVMWGSTNDLGQFLVSKESHEEGMQPYLLDLHERIVQAAGGWAHSVAVTDKGNVCTWGWTACAPSANPTVEQRARLIPTSNCQSDKGGTSSFASSVRKSECSTQSESQEAFNAGGASSAKYNQTTEQIEKVFGGHALSSNEIRDTTTHKRSGSKGPFRFDKIADSLRQSVLDMGEVPPDDNTTTMDDNVISQPWLISLAAGVTITSVAAGGRHTIALSDTGQVWGWGYGEEGQLGLGSRVDLMSTPQLIHCLEAPLLTCNGSSNHNERSNLYVGILGNRVTRIACGGRHSAVLTDSGAVVTFGWGLYGQCGQGSTEDQLSPVYVSALGGIKVTELSAGLWHTVFVTEEGDVYSNGGNQFGQLGTLGDHAEMLPTLVDSPMLENEFVVSVSCGARHTAILTDKGKLFCWGWNKYGQLGTGDSVDRDTPVEVPLENAVARSLACGWWHTLALVEEDQICL